MSGQDGRSGSRSFVATAAEDTPGVQAVTFQVGQFVVVQEDGENLRLLNEAGTTLLILRGPDLRIRPGDPEADKRRLGGDNRVNLATLLPPISPSDISADVRRLLDRHGNLDVSRHRVFGGRHHAHKVAAGLPDAAVALDFAEVEVATTPFLDELLKLRPRDTWEGMNEDVAESAALVREWHGRDA